MVRLFSIFAVFAGLAAPVAAGPWLREKGSTFTSVAFATTWDLQSSSTTYLEYGWSDTTTIGADIGVFRSPTSGQDGFATVFLRKPLGKNAGSSRLAYELGLGASWEGALVFAHLKTGLTWGRGFQLREKSGWMTVDASVRWDLGRSNQVTKIDSTVGLNFNEKFSGMFQLFLTNTEGDTFAKLAPSLIYTPKSGKFKIQVGLEALTDDIANPAIKLGLWREF